MVGRFHDFRHTFASRVARSTSHPQPKHIAVALGHLTQGLADKVYIHPDADYQRELVENLPD
jgi:integrase